MAAYAVRVLLGAAGDGRGYLDGRFVPYARYIYRQLRRRPTRQLARDLVVADRHCSASTELRYRRVLVRAGALVVLPASGTNPSGSRRGQVLVRGPAFDRFTPWNRGRGFSWRRFVWLVATWTVRGRWRNKSVPTFRSSFGLTADSSRRTGERWRNGADHGLRAPPDPPRGAGAVERRLVDRPYRPTNSRAEDAGGLAAVIVSNWRSLRRNELGPGQLARSEL